MRILFLLLILLLIGVEARADEADELFCNKSSNCKKVCDLKRQDKYSDLDEENQKLMLKCMEDLSIKL